MRKKIQGLSVYNPQPPSQPLYFQEGEEMKEEMSFGKSESSDIEILEVYKPPQSQKDLFEDIQRVYKSYGGVGSYESYKQDIEDILKKINKGGLIDSNISDETVEKLNQLAEEYASQEEIEFIPYKKITTQQKKAIGKVLQRKGNVAQQ